MSDKPTYAVSTIGDIKELPKKGPWPTKSNGQLNVLFGIDFINITEKYFHYEESELSKISNDIRGLRSYCVSGLKLKSIGADEWHRLRNELIFVNNGSAKLTCEDINGSKKEVILDQTMGIWVPPFILHTYEALQDNTELLVIANTLFLPDDPSTHDSFSRISFQQMQQQYQI